MNEARGIHDVVNPSHSPSDLSSVARSSLRPRVCVTLGCHRVAKPARGPGLRGRSEDRSAALCHYFLPQGKQFLLEGFSGRDLMDTERVSFGAHRVLS